MFEFLEAEFPEICTEADRAVATALADPRTSCFYSRRVIEQSVRWAFNADRSLQSGFNDTLSDLLNDPVFKRQMSETVFHCAKDVVRQGNRAVHETTRISQRDSITALSKLFQFSYWFARTYCRGEKPSGDLRFDPRYLPVPKKADEASVEQIRNLQEALERSEAEHQRALEELADRAILEAEFEKLKAEVAEAKKLATATPDDHDYSEAETRDYFIDLLLAEAGWPFAVHQPVIGKDVEFEVTAPVNL